MKGRTDEGAILRVVSYQLLTPKTMGMSLQNLAIFKIASFY